MALSDYMKAILNAMTSSGTKHGNGLNNGNNDQNKNQSQEDFTGKAGAAAGDAFNPNQGQSQSRGRGQGQGGGQSGGQGGGQGQSRGKPFDEHINGKGEYESLDGTKARDSEITNNDIIDAINNALDIAKFNDDLKDAGGGKGNFNREIVDKKTRTTQPWRSIMRNMVQKIQYKRSFNRLNYRLAAARVVAPKTTSYKQHSDIIFAIDVSGSMSDKTVNNIMNEVLALSRTTNIKNMRVLFWDGAVTGDIEVKNGKKLGEEKGFFNFIGGGGTNIDCVYNYIIDNKYEPSGVCYLTDGFVEGSEIYTGKRNDCENVFLITSHGSPEAMKQIKTQHNYTNMSIYQTDL